MERATLVTVEEYLETSYRPDCEYIDGVLVERNVGEYDHARLQGELFAFLRRLEKALRIHVLIEQRVQVKPTRFRVPDVCVLKGGRPPGGIVTQPPFLCIEILSPRDRMSEMQQRVDDYLDMGVAYVWVVDPITLDSYRFTSAGIERNKEGVLKTADPEITVRVTDLLDLDK
jgi:Uma2 family endonuclease